MATNRCILPMLRQTPIHFPVIEEPAAMEVLVVEPEPEVSEPEVSEPEVSEPEVSEPEVETLSKRDGPDLGERARKGRPPKHKQQS